MDIASDGTVSVRQGAGAATWEVVSPASDKTVDQNGQPIVPAYAYSDLNPPPVPPQFAAALTQAAANDPSPFVRSLARAALANLGK